MRLPHLIVVSFPILIFAANIPPLWPGWSYSGCMYEGRNNRLLGPVAQTSSAMSIRTCVETCAMRNMPYAGLESGNQCFCGSSLAFSQPASESQCRSPCPGAPDQMCGGVEYMTVLSKSPEAPFVASPGAAGEASQFILPSNGQSSAAAAPPTSTSVPENPSAGLSSSADSPPSSSPTISPSPVSSVSPTPPQISQYLSVPSTSSSPSSDSTALDLNPGNSVSGVSTSPHAITTTTTNIWTSYSIFRLTPGITGQPRLKDQSNMVVFGSYIQSGATERIKRDIGMLIGVMIVCLSVAIW